MKQRLSAGGLPVARVVAILLALIALPLPGWAQTSTELTKSQLEYNNRGVTLINEGKYDEALGYFQSSLAVGEANVTYLNIGRTYTRMGRCVNAATAFAKVESAPAVASPSSDEIAKILKRYRSDLDETCSSRLRLRCPDAKIAVAIDSSPAIDCPELPVPVTPGAHRVQVSYQGRQEVHTVEAAAGEIAELKLAVPEATVDGPVSDTRQAESSGLRTAAWVSSVSGGVFLATGLVLDQTLVGSQLDEAEAAAASGDRAAYDARLSDYESARDLNRAVFAAGGALAVSGVVMWILSSDEAAQPAPSASVSPREGGASLELHWRW